MVDDVVSLDCCGSSKATQVDAEAPTGPVGLYGASAWHGMAWNLRDKRTLALGDRGFGAQSIA